MSEQDTNMRELSDLQYGVLSLEDFHQEILEKCGRMEAGIQLLRKVINEDTDNNEALDCASHHTINLC